jgi:hypothetical protein
LGDFTRKIIPFALAAVMLLTLCTSVFGTNSVTRWQVNGIPVSDIQDVNPTMVADGSGGAVLGWWDVQNGLRAQRIDSAGARQWNGGDGHGILFNAGGDYPSVAGDGTGGGIFAWGENRDYIKDIFVRRVDKDGAPQWQAGGVRIRYVPAGEYQTSAAYPQAVTDDRGGAIVSWEDGRPWDNKVICVQRVDPAGNVKWTDNGVSLFTNSGSQLYTYYQAIVDDNTGGAVVAWSDNRSNLGGTIQTVYAARVDADGNRSWADGGVQLSKTDSPASGFSLANDTVAGQSLVTWSEKRGGASQPWGLYVQKLDSSGNKLWAQDGVSVIGDSGVQGGGTSICSDGAGGAIVAWSAIVDGSDGYIYARRISSNGVPQGDRPVELRNIPGSYTEAVSCIQDGRGGAIIKWTDERNTTGGNRDQSIFAQRVDADCAPQWAANGVPVFDMPGHYMGLDVVPPMVSDGANGAIIAWDDMRNRPTAVCQVFAQRLDTQYSIGVTQAANGTIAPPGSTGPVTVEEGANQRFTVAPDEHYRVKKLIVDGVDKPADTSYTFSGVIRDHTLSAEFERVTHTIDVTQGSHGTVEPAGSGGVVTVDEGTNQGFAITPDEGYHISDVTVNSSSIGTPASYTFTHVMTDQSIGASFAIDTFDVAASVDGGHGTVSPPSQTRDWGSSASISCTPEDGYRIASIVDNGVAKPVTETYTIPSVKEKHDVVVRFEVAPLTAPSFVSGLAPDRAPVGTTITVRGHDFGWRVTGGRGFASAVSPYYVTFNQTQATEYSAWTDTEIKVKVPQGATAGPLVVTTPAGSSNDNHTFTPEYPLVPIYYLAEGSTDHGFATAINIENPMDEDLNVRVNFLLTGGRVISRDVGLPANSQTTMNASDFVGKADFSTRVDCVQGKMIAVDRTMTWTGPGAAAPEAHSATGTMIPQKTWYLAEGSSNWGFETWTLVENPGDSPTKVTLSYMLEGGPVKEVEKSVGAHSRASFDMKADIGGADASLLVTSDLPVVVERSMYRNDRREGSCSMGTPSPGSNFYLAEGSTAWGFTTYLLLENPGPQPAKVTATYMTPDGALPTAPFDMPAGSRKTVKVNDLLPNSDFSIRVTSDRPVVAERAMYWGADTPAGEACHASSGVCSSHQAYYLPDGSTRDSVETYTLVENPNDRPVEVEVSYLSPGGSGNVSFTSSIAPGARKTFSMNDRIADGRAAIKVVSKTPGRGIVVERSMYWNSRTAGTDTIGAFTDSW